MSIKWTEIEVRLGDLVPNPKNPKSSDEATVKRLNYSIDNLGQFENMVVDVDGISAVDGHQRLNAWIDEKGEDFIVNVKKPDRKLTDDEIQEIILLSGKGTHGQWDFEMLGSDFELDKLVDLGGFDENLFNFDTDWSNDGYDGMSDVEGSGELKPSEITVKCKEEDRSSITKVINDALMEVSEWYELG